MDLVSAPSGLVPAGPRPNYRPWTRLFLVGNRVFPAMAGAEDDDGGGDGDKKDDKKEGKGDEQQTFSKEYVDALRQESAGYRTKLRDLEGRFTTLESELAGRKKSEQTDEEKRQQELKDAAAKAEAAERRAREVAVQAAVERSARKLNVVDEDAAYRLLDHEKIELDADGKPINVDALLQELVKAKPFLVAPENGSSGKKGVPGSPKNDGSDGKSREEIVKQTREEMAASGKYVL